MKLLQNLRKDKKGFTLIEVVIVLAIAALILVIVFLAIAGAQKSQRDNASLDGAAKVIARYQSYLSDNNNNAPTAGVTMTDFTTNYIPVAEVKDGRGNAFTLSTAGNAASISTSRFLIGGTCAANGTLGSGGGSTQIAVVYWSETANKSICKTS